MNIPHYIPAVAVELIAAPFFSVPDFPPSVWLFAAAVVLTAVAGAGGLFVDFLNARDKEKS